MKSRTQAALATLILGAGVLMLAAPEPVIAAGVGKIRIVTLQLLDELGITTSGTYSGVSGTLQQVTDSGATTTTQASFTGGLLLSDGAVGTPAYSFASDTDTGIMLTAGGNLDLVTSGVLNARVSASGIQAVTGVVRVVDGSAASPTHTFTSDADAGLYSTATDGVGIATAGTARLLVEDATATFTVPVLNPVLVEASTAGSGGPNVLLAAESSTVLTNEGSTATQYSTLPSAVAGLRFTFVATDDSDLMRITCASGDTLEINGATSSAAGYAETSLVGNGTQVVIFVALDATQWVAEAVRGRWSIYDGSNLVAATHIHGSYYFSTPAATTITLSTPIKMAGTTTAIGAHGFTHTTNRLTYDGISDKEFLVTVSITTSRAGGGGTLVYSHMLYENGGAVTGARIDRSMSDSGDVGAMTLVFQVTASQDDYYEVWGDSTVTDDVTIEFGSVTITAVSNN